MNLGTKTPLPEIKSHRNEILNISVSVFSPRTQVDSEKIMLDNQTLS
jgi:hypothetical protein